MKDKVKAYRCWFYTRKELDEIGERLTESGAIETSKYGWENVYEWLEADSPIPEIEFNFSREHDILEQDLEEGEAGWGTAEVDGPVSVLLMYDGVEPPDSMVDALAQQIHLALRCPVYLGNIEAIGDDHARYHVAKEINQPGFILELLACLHPSPTSLLEMLCEAMEEEMIHAISQADYGQNAEEAYAELKENIALKRNPSKMSTSMHEAILLYRWMGGELTQKQHVSRALSCYYLLNLNENTTYDYHGDDVTVGILMQSILVLGGAFHEALQQFIVWKILIMHEEEVKCANEEGEVVEEVDIEEHYHFALLLCIVLNQEEGAKVDTLFSHFARVTGHGKWKGRRQAAKEFLTESATWQNPENWPQLFAQVLAKFAQAKGSRLERDLDRVRAWAIMEE